jgi:tetratricopeptide (TPR) repeat protein
MNMLPLPTRPIPRQSFRLVLLTFTLFLLPFLLQADSSTPDLDAANRAYTYGSYDEAARLFQQIIDTQGYSAPLCFNLANAEARAGHPGLAMLNYERARYLAPADADIDHNLQLARKQAGLEPNSYRWWQVMLRDIDWTFWFFLIVTCLVLLFLAVIFTTWAVTLAAALKVPLPVLRKTCKGIFFVCIPLALLFAFIELAVIGFSHRIEGVIVASKEAPLLLSPFDTAEKIGAIPEGELVTVEDRHDNYLRIEARDHHFGWVQAKDIEPVIAGSFDVKPTDP